MLLSGLLCSCSAWNSHCHGSLLLWSTGPRHAHGIGSCGSCSFSCLTACGIFPDQGSNLCLLLWQADSYPPHHQGQSSSFTFESQFPCLENVMDSTSLLGSQRRLRAGPHTTCLLLFPAQKRGPRGGHCCPHGGQLRGETRGLRHGGGGAAGGERPEPRSRRTGEREERGSRGGCQHCPQGGRHAQMGPEAASVPRAPSSVGPRLPGLLSQGVPPRDITL